MSTDVVNIYKSEFTVYIGRAGQGRDGYFGNPIAKGEVCPVCEEIHEDNGSTLDCYEQYLCYRLEMDSAFNDKVKSLKGETLGCFCKPKPCHGDILKKYAEQLNE